MGSKPNGDGADAASVGTETLPLIDLTWDEKSAATAVREACINFGFFLVTNHGVSDARIKEMFEQSKLLFSIPHEEKQKYLLTSNNRGYHNFGAERIDVEKQTCGGTKEVWHIGPEPANAGEPTTNVWPSEETASATRKVMMDYCTAMRAVAKKVVRLLALALELSADYFDALITGDNSMLRLLHYDTTISDPEAGIYACGEHSDYGILTLLATDGVPGLQLRTLDGVWQDARHVEGAFVANVGDMLERWTNDLFRSTKHRVLNTTGRERYSAPFFYDCQEDVRLECLATCHGDGNPPKYAPIVFGDYLHARLKETYGKSLAER